MDGHMSVGFFIPFGTWGGGSKLLQILFLEILNQNFTNLMLLAEVQIKFWLIFGGIGKSEGRKVWGWYGVF